MKHEDTVGCSLGPARFAQALALLANERLYAVSRRSSTFVLPATRPFALVAQNQLAGDDSDFNGTPAIVGHQLFLGSNRFPYCIDAGAGG